LKNSKVVSFLSPFKVGQAGNLWTLPRKHVRVAREYNKEYPGFELGIVKMCCIEVWCSKSDTILRCELFSEVKGEVLKMH